MLNSHLWQQLLPEEKCSCGFVDAFLPPVVIRHDLFAENMDIQT